MSLPNLTVRDLVFILVGMAIMYIFMELSERRRRTPADDSNVTPVPEDEAAPLRALFAEREEQHALPPQLVPAKRGPGRPRKTPAPQAGGTAFSGPRPKLTDEELEQARAQLTAEREKRAPRPKRTH